MFDDNHLTMVYLVLKIHEHFCFNSSIIEKKVGIQQEMIKILEQKNDNNEIIILNYNKMLSNSEKMNQDKDKIIKRQKIKTSVAIGVAILTTIIALWR